MGSILTEKILSNKSASDSKAGDVAIGMLDLTFIQDTSGSLAVRQAGATSFNKLVNPGKTIVFMDHDMPGPSQVLSNDYNLIYACACPGEIVGS